METNLEKRFNRLNEGLYDLKLRKESLEAELKFIREEIEAVEREIDKLRRIVEDKK